MTYVTMTISREKLRLKYFDSDSVVVSNLKTTEDVSKKEFYTPAIELLALICAENMDPRLD